ncbi:EAL domain-containing protein [Methylomarinum sp. Ch1-1]|uniref:EAL domain-containing protein n=1 Tax=Methylomarinum roseum TaxID=3067653 RepID=A0AAU7NWL6_9GAMM|nr:EAL domain-containing protein [Methylomarinum sp. Ch1-1]MDP4522562.1 EAL domain-containing protein [Methylomarinum sp. Ch1-1]
MKPDLVPQNRDMIISREQSNALLKIQRDIMERLTLGADHQSILDALCKTAEDMSAGAVASVMVFDESRSFLKVLAAPSMPADAISALNGLIPGPQAGSCGTAVYCNEPQYVCNTSDDPRWSKLRQFAFDFNICACWSNPVRINEQEPIGSFALSNFEPGQPSEFLRRLLETCAYIAGIVIKRQREESQLWKLAHYDPLTDLPNRSFFNNHLEYAIQIARRTRQKLALLFLDLDKFKDINDTQGHEAGDRVLQYIAQSIESCLRKGDTFARLGGDEFVVLIENLNDTELVTHICEKINNSFKSKFTLNDIDYPLSVSIGVSIFPDNGETAQILLRNADTAMYAAKKQGLGRYQFYQEALTQTVTDRLQLTAEIRQALVQQDFVIHYQPQYCHDNDKIVGAEALVRWRHADKGMIPPAEFIPVAEQSDLINELGIYVLKTACQQCLAWWKRGLPRFSLAVNLSVNQLRPGVAAEFQALLMEIGFPLANLELEVTESLIMKYEDLSELKALQALGIAIAMDDFGIGHSSLAQLKHLPISKLKIDRSFIKDIPAADNDMLIASTIISMGHSMGLKIVAEGVETAAQKSFLAEKGCDLLQGYLLSKPLPAEEFERLLLARQQA